jgi:hypothetical protein
MKKITFTLVYLLMIVFAVNVFNARGNTDFKSMPSVDSISPNKTAGMNSTSLPMILASGTDKPIPELLNFSLFGFGLFVVVGFGWIKKTHDKH